MLTALAMAAGAVLLPPALANAEETALCQVDEETCQAENTVSHVHLVTASGAKATLLNTVSNTLCDVLFLGEVTAEGSPLTISGNLTYTNCVDEKPNACTATEENGPSELRVLREGHELATVNWEGLVKVVCSGISCRYIGTGLVWHALGSLLSSKTNGEISISKQTLSKESGILCPSTNELDIVLEPLEALYLGGEPPTTSLCEKDEADCKSENLLTSFHYKDKAAEILTSLINVKCEALASNTVGEPGLPLEIKAELTFSSCSGGCFVTVVSGPGKFLLERTSEEEAKATSEGFEIFVKCGTTIKCLLGPEKMTGSAVGPLVSSDNGHLTFSKVSMGKGEGATCPEEATLDVLFVASTGAYISG